MLHSLRRALLGLMTCAAAGTLPAAWETVEATGALHPRHEAALVAMEGRLYLLGGRRLQAVDIYDIATNTWSHGAAPKVEVHHFQPVVWEKKIWLVGAMTGGFPRETPLDHIPVYDPATDTWDRGPSLPEDRRRGGAGAAIHNEKLYVVCGIQDGHWSGHVAWLDCLDLKTGAWTRLPDAPRARDHFQVAVVRECLYAAGGRRSSAATKQVFDLVVPEVDFYDFTTGSWSTLKGPEGDFPIPRAGTMSFAYERFVVVAGGESMAQGAAHAEVDALDTTTGRWVSWPALVRGRHGSGLAQVGDALYVASGSGNRGGRPELETLERLPLPPR